MVRTEGFVTAAAAAVAVITVASSTSVVAAVEYKFASTGGDPEAATAGSFGQPTKPWTQWGPKPTYSPNKLPDQYMGHERLGPGSDSQTGWNRCPANKWNQQSKCQTIYINSLDDWCLFAPDKPGAVGALERETVGYCTKPLHGTRLIPDGTITGAHFVVTKSYVQVTGTGDFSSMGVPVDDDGGEMDSGGADDLENPIGGVVYSTALSKSGKPEMTTHWSSFLSANQFCIRACYGPDAAAHCQHIYDVLGCTWNQPASYDSGVFESCDADESEFNGIYTVNGKVSTFHQGDPVTPPPHPVPSSSNCAKQATISNNLLRAIAVGQPGDGLLAGASTNPAKVKTGMATIPTSAPGQTSTSPDSTSVSTDDSTTSGKSAAAKQQQMASSSVISAVVALAASVFAFTVFV